MISIFTLTLITELSLFNGGFYFISEPVNFQIKLPVQISPTIQLNKPTQAQLAVIKEAISKSGHSPNITTQYFENDVHFTKINDGATQSSFTPRSENDWLYAVINFSGYNGDVLKFLYLSIFPPLDITSNIHFYTSSEYGNGEIMGQGFDFIGSSSKIFKSHLSGPQVFNEEVFVSCKENIELYNNLSQEKHEGILRAIELHFNVNRVPKLARLPIIGLFSVIEMILTHKPHDKEIGDSISHQIRTKIALLTPRLKISFDYQSFDDAPAHKIWDALYSYRSCIAHGDHIDFSHKNLRILKNEDFAQHFISDATRKLLSHSLREPDLINDLKHV